MWMKILQYHLNAYGRGANRPEIRGAIVARTRQMTTCGWLSGSSTHGIIKKGLMWLEGLQIEHICDWVEFIQLRLIVNFPCELNENGANYPRGKLYVPFQPLPMGKATITKTKQNGKKGRRKISRVIVLFPST